MNDRAFLDVANYLDSDQECGPAGGPTVRKQIPARRNSDSGCDEKASNGEPHETSEDVADEVYVTPAPYIDHEYSHCHAQLRRPEEIRLVNNFNELYCADAIKRLSKDRSFCKQTGSHMHNRFCFTSYDESEAEYDETVGTFSSHDQTTYSDECSDTSKDFEELCSDDMSEDDGCRRRRRVFRGSSRTLAPRLADNAFRSRDSIRRRSAKHSSRARGRRRFDVVYHTGSPGTGVTRRSKRIIRAPKRPYDDFENPFLIEGEEFNGFITKAVERAKDIYRAGIRTGDTTQNRPQTHLGVDENCPESPGRPVRGRRGRRKGRKAGRRSNFFYASRTFESNNSTLASDPIDSTSEEDEELRYLRMARRRQRLRNDVERDGFSSAASDSSNSQSTVKDHDNRMSEPPRTITSECSLPGKNEKRGASLGISAVWGQSRWAIAQKFSAQSWPDCVQDDLESYDLEESASSVEANVEDLEECDMEEIRHTEPSKSGWVNFCLLTNIVLLLFVGQLSELSILHQFLAH